MEENVCTAKCRMCARVYDTRLEGHIDETGIRFCSYKCLTDYHQPQFNFKKGGERK